DLDGRLKMRVLTHKKTGDITWSTHIAKMKGQ
ncbi:unnamed protein product, partial [marine sediment metagenome]